MVVEFTNTHDILKLKYILPDGAVVVYSVTDILGEQISLYRKEIKNIEELHKDSEKWFKEWQEATKDIDDYDEIAKNWIKKPLSMESFGDKCKRLQSVLDQCISLEEFIEKIK